jgi:hypothetical protein
VRISRSVHFLYLYHTFSKMHGLKGYGGSSMPIAALEAKTVLRRTSGWHGGTCGSQKSSAQKTKELVPEVGIGLVVTPCFDREEEENRSIMKWAQDLAAHYSADNEFKTAVILGVGHIWASVAEANPAQYADGYGYAVLKQVGIEAVLQHCGEWSPAHTELIPASLSHMRGAVEVGVKRIGHGIIY